MASVFKMKLKMTALFLFIAFVPLMAAGVQIDIIQQSAQFAHLKISLPEPELIQEGNAVYASYTEAAFFVDENQNVLPVLVKFLNFGTTHALPFKISSIKTKIKNLGHSLYAQNTQGPTKMSHDWVELEYLGLVGDFPIFALRIFPIKVSADHRQISVLKSIELKIGKQSATSFSQLPGATKNRTVGFSKVLKSVLINKNQQLFALTQLTRPQSQSLKTFNRLKNWQKILNQEYVFKLIVDQEGIYQVTYDDLLKAGFPLSRVDPQNLHLYNKGQEVPIYFKGEQDHQFNQDDYFEFWGERNQRTFQDRFPELYSDPFSDLNVYWLVYTNERGLRLLEESGGISSSANQLVISPFAFRDTLHVEKNSVQHKFGHSPELVNRPAYEIDSYYFDGGISAPGGVGYDFVIPHPAEYGAEVVVTAMFRGKSFYDSQTNPLMGHKVTLKLRGVGNTAHLVGTVKPEDGWKDQQAWIITNADSVVKIEQAALKDGLNRLEVDMFQTGVTDIVVLNWFEISYLRKYQAYHDYLKFHVDRDFFDGRYVKLGDRIQFNIDGFTNKKIDVYKIGISKMTNVDIKPIKDETSNKFSYGISFQDEVVDPSTKYVALTHDQKKKVLKIESFRPWKNEHPTISLLDGTNRANYLIITHDLFLKDCETLRTLKNTQGFTTEVVTVRDIYDAFNYGIKSPLAIKEFIRYVYSSWDQSAPLEYVLLVGDASLNYRSSDDLVPTIFFNTVKFGAAESDFQYSLLKGDDFLPEISVGRLPVSSVYELQNYIDKIEHFPEDPTGKWTNQTLFIAGYDGAREYLTNKPVFRAQNLRLINHKIPSALFADQINSIENKAIQPDPHFGSNQDVINAFNNGLSFINFVGHGGGAIWADAGLMGLEDVERLENGYKLPFISSLTCFTASFANPGRYSLGEKLILSKQKGAIGFLGSSGVGWIYNDFAIAWSLPDYLWDERFTFGEAINLMKMFYLASPFYYTEEGRFYTFGYGSISHSQVSQYDLLGDPSLKIPFPAKNLIIESNPEIALPGDSVFVQIKGFAPASELYVQVTDQQNYSVYQNEYSQVSAPFKVAFRIPENITPQILRIKAFATNHSQSFNGFKPISVQQPLIKRVLTDPESPTINQSLVFKVILKSKEDIKDVRITNMFDEISYENYNVNLPLARMNDSSFVSQPFAGFGKGGNKIFDVQITTHSGETITEHWNKLYVNDPRPDLLVDPGSVSWGGQSKLNLVFKIKNNSEHHVETTRVACYDDAVSTSKPFATPLVHFKQKKEQWVKVPLPENLAYQAYHQIKIIVDADSSYEERDEQNNQISTTLFQNYLVVSPELGTTLDHQTHQKIALSALWSIEIQPGVASQSYLFSFDEQHIANLIEQADQQDLKFVTTPSKNDTIGLKLNFMTNSPESTVTANLSIQLDSLPNNYVRDKIFIYHYNPELKVWSALPSKWMGTELQTTIKASGIYAPFYTTDDDEPLLEISVNGRPLIENMLVPHKPTLGILLQDVNGVDFTQTLELKIDENYIIKGGKILDKSVTLPDSGANVKNIQIVFTPELSPGEHRLFLKVSDVNGNVAQTTLAFKVAEGFNLIVYGNYPNPFKERTIISYYIESSEEIDELTIKIYTTSGRLIRSKMLELDPTVLDDNLLEPNYHEVVWDGTDDDGNPVANGVYFAVIKGKYRGKTIKKILKMARLQ